MRALPQKQDELLKQLNEIESLDRKGISPERSNINIFLIFITLIFGMLIITLGATNSISGNFNSTYALVVIALLLISLTLSYYNNIFGFIASSILVLGINLYFSLNNLMNLTVLNFILIDSLTVFIISNQFKKYGYFAGATLIVGKNIYLFGSGILFSNILPDLIAGGIIIGLIGVIPVLINFIATVSRIAKAKEISSQLLALQNEELLNSWLNTYQSGGVSKPPAYKPIETNTQENQHNQQTEITQSPNTQNSPVYTSIYSNNTLKTSL